MSQWRNSFSGRGKVTKTLIGINVLVFLAQTTSGNAVTALLALYPPNVWSTPWTLLTTGFAHASWIHLALNMYSLWIFGEAIESYVGTRKFLWLYLLSILGGSIAFVFADPSGIAVGASGGIFGLMGAYFIIMRALGFRSSQMLVLIALNVVMGFVNPGIAISAHIGGLAAGGAVAWYYTKLKR
jgi:membrane associated rhomboid family serine protease